MATSGLMNSQVGESGSTNSTQELKHAQTLREITDELAEILVLYQKAGGDILGVTLASGNVFGSQHALVLPADKIGNAYSLRSENVTA